MSDHELGALAAIDDGTARKFTVAGRAIAVVRIGERAYAIGDTCSHADVSLSEGEVDVEACEIECWKHGSSFSLATGEPMTLPATRPVPVYDVRVVAGQLVLTVENDQ